MKNKKPTITYIKNGEEKTVEINLINLNKIKKEIFNSNEWRELALEKDIEYIHFQNIDLPIFKNNKKEFCGIKNNCDTICVLENCNLKNKLNNEVSRIELKGGIFQLININTNEFKTEIAINSYQETLIDNTNLTSNNQNLSLDSFYSFQKLNIKDNNTIKKMCLSTEEITLSGKFLLDDLSLISDNIIKIGNETTNTKILLTETKNHDIVIESNNLELNNCSIINNTTSNIYLNYNKIIGNKFIIKSKGNIIVNNKVVYKEKNNEGYVVLTIKDLLRLKLNSILSSKLHQIEKQIELNTDQELIENPNLQLETNIKYQEELIEYNIKILKELREELVNWKTTKRNNLVKSLKNKPVKDYN